MFRRIGSVSSSSVLISENSLKALKKHGVDLNDREYYEKMYPERNLPEGAMVTRFGPSPTGFVHMGSLFGAFCDSVFARQTNGVFFLRIEDTDPKRIYEPAYELIQEDLKWLGIEPDEVYYQSDRFEIY